MNKKIKMLSITIMMLVMLSGLSGCVTPGKDFDTVKIIATVTRNGGDYTLEPTGESGYELNVAIATMSIEALNLDIDQQEIKTQYKTAEDNYQQLTRNMYGGGVLGRIKGWWHRMKDGYHTNTIGDLTWADGGGFFDINLPVLDKYDALDYLGVANNAFELNISNTESIADYGLGIYTATIPRAEFPNAFPEPGWILMNNPDTPTDNGLTMTPEGQNTGYVMWDGTDYQIVVLTNTPAFASSRPKNIYVSLVMIKPDGLKASQTVFNDASDYYSVFEDGMKDDLDKASSNLKNNLDTTLSTAVDTAFSSVPGYGIAKSFSDVTSLMTPDGTPDYVKKELKDALEMLSDDRGKVYKTAWAQLKKDIDGATITMNLGWGLFGGYSVTIDVDNGLTDKEIKGIIDAYSNTGVWWVFGNEVLDNYGTLMSCIKDDWENHMLKALSVNNIQSKAMNGEYGDILKWSDTLMSFRLIDDAYLGVFDSAGISGIKEILDMDWAKDSVDIPTLDYIRDVVKDVVAEIEVVIPDWLTESISGIEEDVSVIEDELDAVKSDILVIMKELKDISIFMESLVPTSPKVSIFAYQVPGPVFTKITGENNSDYAESDPSAVFSATVSVVVGGNYTLDTGYPRAVVDTRRHGVLNIVLEHDTVTDVYILRKDMIGVDNFTIGDTVKTHFEVSASNATNTLTARTLTYYTRICKSWMQDFLDLIIDGPGDFINGTEPWFDYDENPFFGGNTSGLESFNAVLTVTNKDGEELYIRSPRKNFKMKQNDSEYLVWEVMIFEDEEYQINIVVGNATVDGIVSYTSSINDDTKSMWNPLNWGTKIREWI